jgi:hypothetical protein
MMSGKKVFFQSEIEIRIKSAHYSVSDPLFVQKKISPFLLQQNMMTGVSHVLAEGLLFCLHHFQMVQEPLSSASHGRLSIFRN